MRTIIARLTLGALVASVLIASSNAQVAGATRERALRDCNAVQNRDGHDPYSRNGGVLYHYQACMAERGQPE